MRHPTPRPHRSPVARLTVAAAAAIVALCLCVVWLLGGFSLMTTVLVDGVPVRVVNTFATVDHPFHATRAHTLLTSLQHGEVLRWIGHHHGGYPAEFYPLGIAWIDVALWALFFGAFPIIAIHSLTVILVFLLPVVAFWLLARGDGVSPFVAVLAFAIHLAIPGHWSNGGYLELVEWGLVSNVGGATFALIALAAIARYVVDGTRWLAVLAILVSSAALFANTRSAIAVVTGAVCVVLATSLVRDDARSVAFPLAVRRVLLIGVPSILLTAPLLLAMLRFANLYEFVHFQEFATFGQFRDAVAEAVTWWYLPPALIGIVIVILAPHLTMMRIVALTAAVYALLIVLFSRGGMDDNLINQLETPRLMPFLRFLLIYLAAAAIGWVLARIARRLRSERQAPAVAIALMIVAVITISAFPGAFRELPGSDKTSLTPMTGVEEFVRFEEAIRIAETIRPDGTAIYVVGDRESWWHQQLWGPSFSPAPFYYDDWMWHWHQDRDGPFVSGRDHHFLDPAQTFTDDWLHAHGVGALVVTDMSAPENPRAAAAHSPSLDHRATSGQWDVYVVEPAAQLVMNGATAPGTIMVENHRIVATFEDAAGEVAVRHNWFPRWRAYADGQRVEIERASDGMMRIDVPDGTREIELVYAVTGLDWIARFAVVIGVLGTLWVAIGRPGWPMRLSQA